MAIGRLKSFETCATWFNVAGSFDRGTTVSCKYQLCASSAALVPETQARALALDAEPNFPAADVEILRDLGALAAPVPVDLGGLGLGTEANGAIHLAEVLRLIGRGNLSLGRLYEAHVNVLRLIARYGTERQMQHAADLALDGQLFGLWVTDAPDAQVYLTEDLVLHGTKAPCSGAGHVRHALITARLPDGATRMVIIGPVPARNADPSGWVMQGMRAARNGRIIMEGISVAASALIGSDGDYLREPDFSAGAWRGAAVALGGLEALVAEMRATLVDATAPRMPISEPALARRSSHLRPRACGSTAPRCSARPVRVMPATSPIP